MHKHRCAQLRSGYLDNVCHGDKKFSQGPIISDLGILMFSYGRFGKDVAGIFGISIAIQDQHVAIETKQSVLHGQF